MRLSTTCHSQSTFNNLETQSSLEKRPASWNGKVVLDREASPIPVCSRTPKFILSLKSTSLDKKCIRSSSPSRLFPNKPNFWQIPLKSLDPESRLLPQEVNGRGNEAGRSKHPALRKIGSLDHSSFGLSSVGQPSGKKSQSQMDVVVPEASLHSRDDLNTSQDVKKLLNKEIRDPIEVKLKALSRYNNRGSRSPGKPILHLQSPKYCPRSLYNSNLTIESPNLSTQPRKSVEKKVHFSKNLLIIFFDKDKDHVGKAVGDPPSHPESTCAAPGGKRTVYFRRPTRKPIQETVCLEPRSGHTE